MFTKKTPAPVAAIPAAGAGALKATPFGTPKAPPAKKKKPASGPKPAWQGVADKMLGKPGC